MEKQQLITENLVNYQQHLLSGNLGQKERQELIDSKNNFLREEINDQLKGGIFHVEIPFTYACPQCNGYGERYQFREPIEIRCDQCTNGHKKISCPTCKGTGKFVKKMSGLTIRVNCKTCDGIGEIEKKCISCNGTGKIKRMISAKRIIRHQTCDLCDGSGIIIPRNVTNMINPLIPTEVADMLKSL